MNRNVLIGALVIVIVVFGSYGYISYGKGTLIVELTDPPRDWGARALDPLRAQPSILSMHGFALARWCI